MVTSTSLVSLQVTAVVDLSSTKMQLLWGGPSCNGVWFSLMAIREA